MGHQNIVHAMIGRPTTFSAIGRPIISYNVYLVGKCSALDHQIYIVHDQDKHVLFRIFLPDIDDIRLRNNKNTYISDNLKLYVFNFTLLDL